MQLNELEYPILVCAGYLAYKEELEQIQRGKHQKGGAAVEAKKIK